MPAKVARAGSRAVDPDKPEREDFSALVTAALKEYLNRHHPGLIEEVSEELKAAARSPAPVVLLVAEDKAVYGPTVDDLEAGEIKRRAKVASATPKGRGAGPTFPATSKTGRR
jgi:hypothetical protein